MSVVAAVPKDGYIYFASDNQKTLVDVSSEIEDINEYKLKKIGNFIVGVVGNIAALELVYSIFDSLRDKDLNKEMLVNSFLPMFINRGIERCLFNSKNIYEGFPAILVGKEDILYQITGSSILRIEAPIAIGTGSINLTSSILDSSKDIKNSLKEAIRKYGSRNIYVNKTIISIDTKDMKLEVDYGNSL